MVSRVSTYGLPLGVYEQPVKKLLFKSRSHKYVHKCRSSPESKNKGSSIIFYIVFTILVFKIINYNSKFILLLN